MIFFVSILVLITVLVGDLAGIFQCIQAIQYTQRTVCSNFLSTLRGRNET